MKCTLDKESKIKEVVKIVNDLVVEAKMVFNKEGFIIWAMDPANVAMINVNVPANKLTNYVVENEESIVIAMTEFKQIMARMDNADITFETKDSKLVISCKGKVSKEFRIPLIDEDKKVQVPALAFKADFKITTKELNDSVEDVKIMGKESLIFDVEGTTLYTTSDGEEAMGKAVAEVPIIGKAIAEKQKGKYSIEYVEKMINTRISTEVCMRFQNDYPLQLEYDIKGISVVMILAPRIENNN